MGLLSVCKIQYNELGLLLCPRKGMGFSVRCNNVITGTRKILKVIVRSHWRRKNKGLNLHLSIVCEKKNRVIRIAGEDDKPWRMRQEKSTP